VSLLYLLDTDAVVDILRRRHGVSQRLAQLSPEDVGVSSMTVAELLYGALCSKDRERSEREVRRFLDVVRIVPFGRAAAAAHSQIRHRMRRQTIGPNDLVIAATAVTAKATVVTANVREFARVEGLAVENWR
jgi:tRNA(fMet)-specific endonuclease VapC